MGSLPNRLRLAILERDGNRCVYCGRGTDEVALEIDHVIPKSASGSDQPGNLATSCRQCNNAKRATTLGVDLGTVLARPMPDWFSSRPSLPRHRSVPRSVRSISTLGIHAVCDLCGARATAAHLLPWKTNVQMAVLACAKHDPGGYWFYLARWTDSDMRGHLLRGHDNMGAAMVDTRLDGEWVGDRLPIHWRAAGDQEAGVIAITRATAR